LVFVKGEYSALDAVDSMKDDDMHRIFIDSYATGKGACVTIGAEEARHAYVVLRLRAGEPVIVLDGNGRYYEGLIRSLSMNKGEIVLEKVISAPEDIPELSLACALPKHSKFDEIVDAATQYGVREIIPLRTQRTIVTIAPEQEQLKRNRWQKIAVAAAKQCGCAYLPLLRPVQDFFTALTVAPTYDLALIAALHRDAVPIKEVISERKSPKTVIVFIGPEGDFSPAEVAAAQQQGCRVISLGQRVLRCATAVNMILSVVNYEWKT
jgi:16S rRNA (uracil1498-N3)-methyltransferase